MAQKKDNLHNGHRKRMRERFLQSGLKGFSDHEILEMLLFYALPRRDTNGLAHEILDEYKTLANVFDADIESLQKMPHVGEHTSIFLTMIPELFWAYEDSRRKKGCLVEDTRALGEYAVSMFRGKRYEEFALICLDSNRRVHWSGTVVPGTIDQVDAYPRLVTEKALQHNAKTVAFAHNHPGGTIRPSAEDRRATQILVEVLNSIDVTVIDHIIVAGDRYYSMSEAGTIF